METGGGGEWRCEGGGEFDKPDLLMLLYTWSSPHSAAAATLFMMLFVIIFSWHFAPSSPFYHCRAALLYLYSMKTLFKPTPLVTLTVQLYVLFYLLLLDKMKTITFKDPWREFSLALGFSVKAKTKVVEGVVMRCRVTRGRCYKNKHLIIQYSAAGGCWKLRGTLSGGVNLKFSIWIHFKRLHLFAD